jgi:hypothetical protein
MVEIQAYWLYEEVYTLIFFPQSDPLDLCHQQILTVNYQK